MKLVDCFVPVLAVVRHFTEAPHDDAPALSAQLQPLLATAQQDAFAIGTSEEDYRAALFAVAAWIDEALLTREWAAADAWQGLLLQRQFFGISNAGVAFFEHLARLDGKQADVEAVYVLCLSMGFKGRFGHDGDMRELASVRMRSLRRVLAHASAGGMPEAAALVFPGVAGGGASGPAPRFRPRWMPSRLTVGVLSVSVLALLTLYFILFSTLQQQVHAILPLIR